MVVFVDMLVVSMCMLIFEDLFVVLLVDMFIVLFVDMYCCMYTLILVDMF